MSAPVTRYIVQERCELSRDVGPWIQDSGQSMRSEKTLSGSRSWLRRHTSAYPHHANDYRHRIVERTERVVFEQNAAGERIGGQEKTHE